MREVRVRCWVTRGLRTWWQGEDDDGFSGDAETFDELLAMIDEWTEAHGLAQPVTVYC